jgi:methylisocitrate lyase
MRQGKANINNVDMLHPRNVITRCLGPDQNVKIDVEGPFHVQSDDRFVIMARTDAHAVEGQQAAIDRAAAYVEAGADMIFAEALTTLDEYREFTTTIDVPVLANLTDFGMTPYFSADELGQAGVRIALYPLAATRAMVAAAEMMYQTIRVEGTQRGVVDAMQTRDDLYEVLGYHDYEKKLDQLFVEQGLTKDKD